MPGEFGAQYVDRTEKVDLGLRCLNDPKRRASRSARDEAQEQNKHKCKTPHDAHDGINSLHDDQVDAHVSALRPGLTRVTKAAATCVVTITFRRCEDYSERAHDEPETSVENVAMYKESGGGKRKQERRCVPEAKRLAT